MHVTDIIPQKKLETCCPAYRFAPAMARFTDVTQTEHRNSTNMNSNSNPMFYQLTSCISPKPEVMGYMFFNKLSTACCELFCKNKKVSKAAITKSMFLINQLASQ